MRDSILSLLLILILVEALVSGASRTLVLMLTVLLVVINLPFALTVVSGIVARFRDIPDPESVEEAEMWLMTHGYEIVHRCGEEDPTRPTHIVGQKRTRIPLVRANQEFWVMEDEE